MNSDIKSLWDMCLPILEQEIFAVSFNTWIKPLQPHSMDFNSIILSTDADIVKSMVTNRYIDLIKNVVKEVTGKEYAINIVIGTPQADEPLLKEKTEKNPYSRYTFENFIVGNSNRFAQAASLAVAESPAAAYNPLFIYGGVGLGKTHLMHSISNYIKASNKDAKIIFTTSEAFMNEFYTSIEKNTTEQFKNKYRNIDVLLIDDIQFIAGKVRTEEEFFHTFNALTSANSQIVITSDRPPREIKTLSDRLVNRFESGLICDIAPPDYETRIAILKKKAENEGVSVDISVLAFIAEKVTSNIRELEGIFNRVIAFKGLLQEDISRDTVIKVLKDYSDNGKTILTAEYIIEYCAKFYNVAPEKIYSNSQKHDITKIRQISFYLCKEVLDLSLQKIGQVCNRDHTTVLHGIKKIEKLMKEDKVFKETMEMLVKDIKNETSN
ncbi:MAG: chromosomal replication initiator protein DnaA [Clostridia bacterium]|nr:chromosomal replication initiator protein DnaA [Clostridia bacterium]